MTAEVSREEFGMLRDQVSALTVRVDTIDQGGTRGILVVQTQITDMAKDINELKLELAGHERTHLNERHERQSGRRWLIGIGITFLAAVEGPLLWIISHGHFGG